MELYESLPDTCVYMSMDLDLYVDSKADSNWTTGVQVQLDRFDTETT
jgi:hypothetical protein